MFWGNILKETSPSRRGRARVRGAQPRVLSKCGEAAPFVVSDLLGQARLRPSGGEEPRQLSTTQKHLQVFIYRISYRLYIRCDCKISYLFTHALPTSSPVWFLPLHPSGLIIGKTYPQAKRRFALVILPTDCARNPEIKR